MIVEESVPLGEIGELGRLPVRRLGLVSGQFDRKVGPVVLYSTEKAKEEVEARYPGQHPLFIRTSENIQGVF